MAGVSVTEVTIEGEMMTMEECLPSTGTNFVAGNKLCPVDV